MQIAVAYARTDKQVWFEINMPDGATVREAIEHSGVINDFPEIDLEANKVGIFARPVKLDQALKDGDRIEIYRPLIADPKQVRKKAAPKKQKPAAS